MKFAECMRDNGVSEFPDPDASSDQEFVDGVVNAGPEHRGVEEGHRRVQGPAAAGLHWAAKRTPSSRAARLKFAQCIRENGVKDFPDPANGEPLVDTNRIPSANREGGMTILNAAMAKCGDAAADALGDRVTRKPGAGRGGVLVAVTVSGVVASGATKRPRPRSEAPANTARWSRGSSRPWSPWTGP